MYFLMFYAKAGREMVMENQEIVMEILLVKYVGTL